jgi:hypothetical protein
MTGQVLFNLPSKSTATAAVINLAFVIKLSEPILIKPIHSSAHLHDAKREQYVPFFYSYASQAPPRHETGLKSRANRERGNVPRLL